MRKIDEEETRNFDIEKWILELVRSEKMPHTVITLTKQGTLEEIRKLCLSHLPPFEENSDKGFKDAYMYFTILEYLENSDGENIFLITKDNRLRMAFEENPRVIVVKDYDEFEKYVDSYFREDYFVSRLKEEVSVDITNESIQEIWLNTAENWVIKLIIEDKQYFVEVDFSSREIVDFTDYNFSEGIRGLIISGAFRATHSYIEMIRDYIRYFSDQEIQNLIEAATENDQIYSIATNEEVKEFFITIFKSKSKIIPEETRSKFKQYFLVE